MNIIPELNYIYTFKKTIEEIESAPYDSDFIVQQLTRGTLSFEAEVVTLPGLIIERNIYGARLQLTQVVNSNDLSLALALDAPQGAPLWLGKPINHRDVIVLKKGKDHVFNCLPQTRGFVVTVDSKIVEERGWSDLVSTVYQLPETHFNLLITTCRHIFAIAKMSKSHSLPINIIARLREEVLRILSLIITPWISLLDIPSDDYNSHRFSILTQAEAFADDHEGNQIPKVDKICSRLNISKRTLHRYFKDTIGLGPHEYFYNKRLHAFRKDLLKVSKLRGEITPLAIHHGFNHLGRLSEKYKEIFGESPHETVANNCKPKRLSRLSQK